MPKQGLQGRARACLAVGLIALQVWQPVLAGVVASNPQITQDRAANGVPVVNIATPGQSGISHNTYTRFDVDRQGLILNNSGQPVNTQLGGYVPGNANLHSGSARLILNEVSGNLPSKLKGYMEIAGQKAEMVIANTAGITCNGCGFINTSRGTLTTGKPLLGSDGSLSGFRVEDGLLNIEGLGLNASNTDRLNLYSRALVLNAELHARDLHVVTGANDIGAVDGVNTPRETGTPAPAFAIDSSSLGGMYANRIRLVGTEAGVGMRLAAPVAALNGNLEITSNGDVRLANTSSSHDFTLRSDAEITIDGQMAAGQKITVNADALTVSDRVTVNAHDIDLTVDALDTAANSEMSSRGTMRIYAGRIENAGNLASAATLRVESDAVANTGVLAAKAGVHIDTDELHNHGTISSATGLLELEMASGLDNDEGEVLAGKDLKLTLPSFDQAETGGLLQALGEMSIIASGNIRFSGDAFATPGSLRLSAPGQHIDLDNRLDVGGGATLLALSVNVASDAKMLANGKLKIQANQLVNNGILYGQEGMHLMLDERLDNRGTERTDDDGGAWFQGAMLLSKGTIRIEGLTGERLAVLNNTGSQIESLGGDIDIKAQALNNHNTGWSLSQTMREVLETVYSDACNKYCGSLDEIWNLMFDGEYHCCYVAGAENAAPVLYESTFYDKAGKSYENVWLYRTRSWMIRRNVEDGGNPAGIIANRSLDGDGGDVFIVADTVDNDRSAISAANVLDINAREIRNTATRRYDTHETLRESRKKSCDDSDCDPMDGIPVRQTADYPSRPDQIISAVLEGREVNLHGTEVIRNADGQAGEVIRSSTTITPKGPWQDLPSSAPATPEKLLPGQLDPTLRSGFQLPNGGLFQRSRNPDHPYLIETDRALNTYEGFLGSGYLLEHLDWAPDMTQRRLGDSYYELMLIREVLLASIGSRFVDASVTDEREQFEYLTRNAVAAAESLRLSPGVSLSREQVDALQEDIVWLEEKAVLGERVLVPVVYLAKGSVRLLANGAVIGGGTVKVTGGELHNSGLMRADTRLTAEMQADIENRGGSLQSGGELLLDSKGDILNESGQIVGRSIELVAAGNITHRTWSGQDEQQGSNGHSWSTRMGQQALVQAETKIQQTAGSHLRLVGARVDANDVEMSAGGSLIIDTVRLDQGYDLKDGSLEQAEAYTRHLATQVSALQTLQMKAGGDLMAIAADIRAGTSATLDAGGNLLLLAAEETDHYERHSKHDGSMGRSQSHDVAHDESHLRGTTIRVGVPETSSANYGNLTLNAGKDITLYASQAAATGQVDVTAGGSLNLIAGINTVSHQEQSSKENAATYRNNDQGYIHQTAAASAISAGGDLNLNAGQNIRLTASVLHSGQTLRMGEETVDPASLTATSPQRPVNVIVDTLALTNESWNETEKGFKGPLKELVKGLSLILTPKLEILSAGLIDLPETEIASFSKSRTVDVLQAGSLLQADNIAINATDTVTLINADVSATGVANVSANDIIIGAIAETHTAMHEEGHETVSGLGMRFGRDEVRVAGVQMVKSSVADAATLVEWNGSTINADQLVLNAKRDLEILSSTINVSGDATLSAGHQLTLGGHEAIQTRENKQITEVATVSASIRNAYLDAALAVKAMSEAVEGIKEAKRALAEAEERADRGELDPDDVKYFQMNLAAATANLVQMEIAMAAALAMGAATAGTGFYASGSAQREKVVTTSTTTQGVWQGSNVSVGGNATFAAGDKIKVQGSDVTVKETLTVNADKIVLLAGEEHSSSESNTVRDSQGISMSATGGGINAGMHETDADSLGTHYVNSHFHAGKISSTSKSLQLAGAVIEADHVDAKTGKLSVVSLQDTFDAKSKSVGGNIGISGGSGGVTGASIAADFQKSETERRWVTGMSGIIGHDSISITADDTLLTGAIIANARRDASGGLVDQGQLQLKTKTLTIANLYDVDKTKAVGANLAVGIKVDGGGKSHGAESNAPIGNTSTGAAAEARKGNVPVDSITAGGLYNGHVTERTTFATLGKGLIEVGGEILTEENAATLVRSPNGALLNRDVANTQLITKDQDIGGLNASVTVDGRLFSEAGREEMWQEQQGIGHNWQVVATGLEKDVQMVTVDVTPNSIDGALKFVDKFPFLGLLPFDKADNGGLLSQLPVLVGARDIHQNQITVISADHPYAKEHPELFQPASALPSYDDLAAEGKAFMADKLVSLEPVTISKETATFQNFTNGMFNTMAEAAVNGGEQTGSAIFTLNYNPRHGFLADVLEIGVDKSGAFIADVLAPFSKATGIDIGFASGAALETGTFMADVMRARGDRGGHFAAHSQGNLLMQSGLLRTSLKGIDMFHQEMISTETKDVMNFSVGSYGSPVNNSDMGDLLKIKRMVYASSVANEGDFVTMGFGGNTGVYSYDAASEDGMKAYVTPFLSIDRWVDSGNPLDLMFGTKYAVEGKGLSPHSSYKCIAICGEVAPWEKRQ